MIQINLVPDVKQELLNAQRQRTMVISFAVLASIIAAGVVAVLAFYLFAVQGARNYLLNNSIDDLSGQISEIDDLPNALTVQKQLSTLSSLYDQRTNDSRVFDLLSTIVPTGENRIQVSKFTLNSEENTIVIEAQAERSYRALETFKKTILATSVNYTQDGETTSEPLTTAIVDGDQSYGEDASGKRVLRFTLSFVYPENLFMTTMTNVTIKAPTTETNVTDSKINVPSTLFTSRATDEEGE